LGLDTFPADKVVFFALLIDIRQNASAESHAHKAHTRAAVFQSAVHQTTHTIS